MVGRSRSSIFSAPWPRVPPNARTEARSKKPDLAEKWMDRMKAEEGSLVEGMVLSCRVAWLLSWCSELVFDKLQTSRQFLIGCVVVKKMSDFNESFFVLSNLKTKNDGDRARTMKIWVLYPQRL